MSRLDLLPPYLFSALDKAKAAALAAGVDVIDLGIGDPDRPTPPALLRVMTEAVGRAAHHRYPPQRGSQDLRRAIASYVRRRCEAEIDSATQVLTLLGSKEGLGHLPLAVLTEGDEALVPDLGYPVYTQATLLAGGRPVVFPLRAEAGFLPDPDRLAGLCGPCTRMVFLNYPNNPTGAVAGGGFWREMVALAREKDIVLVNDAAYLEVTLDGSLPTSLLEHCDPAADPVIELHSLSKMFNMTGWRVAFAVGNPRIVGALGRVKESMDSGVFGAVQETAAVALGDSCEQMLAEVMRVYPARRETILAALRELGIEVFPSPATFYVWARVPGDESSADFCGRALREIGVVLTPGNGFGPGGEGWFRISLTAPDEAIAEGAARLRRWR